MTVRYHLVHFSNFGIFGPIKIWQPCARFTTNFFEKGKETKRAIWDRCYDFFFKIRRKIWRKYRRFFTQILKGNFAEKVIIIFVFEKNAKIFAENGQKPQKIVIITSVPGNFSPSQCLTAVF
jgi:hypothetical protein